MGNVKANDEYKPSEIEKVRASKFELLGKQIVVDLRLIESAIGNDPRRISRIAIALLTEAAGSVMNLYESETFEAHFLVEALERGFLEEETLELINFGVHRPASLSGEAIHNAVDMWKPLTPLHGRARKILAEAVKNTKPASRQDSESHASNIGKIVLALASDIESGNRGSNFGWTVFNDPIVSLIEHGRDAGDFLDAIREMTPETAQGLVKQHETGEQAAAT
jgi:hypothetical protein